MCEMSSAESTVRRIPSGVRKLLQGGSRVLSGCILIEDLTRVSTLSPTVYRRLIIRTPAASIFLKIEYASLNLVLNLAQIPS